jgi:uncharacterized protein (DUF1330 family)
MTVDHAPVMGSVYFIASYDITNADKYEKEYVPGVLRTLPEVGGRVIVASGSACVIEGPAPGQTVVLRFPSEEAFRSWYDSNGSLMQLRVETTTNSSVVLEW